MLFEISPQKDASLLAFLHASAFPAPWSNRAFEGLLSQPGVSAWGGPDGFILIRFAADEAEIVTLAVRPEARGRGLGRALVGKAEAAAREAGIRAIFLEVGVNNAPALALYRAAGYCEVGRRIGYYANGEDALLMRLTLGVGQCNQSSS